MFFLQFGPENFVGRVIHYSIQGMKVVTTHIFPLLVIRARGFVINSLASFPLRVSVQDLLDLEWIKFVLVIQLDIRRSLAQFKYLKHEVIIFETRTSRKLVLVFLLFF
jgi:hypothetical protein